MIKQILKLTSYKDKLAFYLQFNTAVNKIQNHIPIISFKDKLNEIKTFNNKIYYNNKTISYKDKLGTWGSLKL